MYQQTITVIETLLLRKNSTVIGLNKNKSDILQVKYNWVEEMRWRKTQGN